MKKIIVCFDGTGNEPEDAHQKKIEGGSLEDSNISNVLKLHLLAGGSLDNSSAIVDGQHSLYFSGVGTRGSFFRRILRQAFALCSPQIIMNEALRDLEKIYDKEDRLYVYGFSRGAAIARKFASLLAREGLQTKQGMPDPHPVIEMLGVWDTVASFGAPNLDSRNRPLSDVVFENGTVSTIVRNAYHLLSLDENRLAFRPTLMNAQDKISEIWFSGVHSDIGGGYLRSGLSDITLEFMKEKSLLHGLHFLDIADIPDKTLRGVDQDGDRITIDREDIESRPDHRAVIHKHSESWRDGILKDMTTAARDLVVMKNDLPSERLPIIHHTVSDRMRDIKEYRPYSLNGEAYHILTKNGEIKQQPVLG